MNVRITSTPDSERTILDIAGRLMSVDLSELNKEIDLVNGTLVLDLSELLSADESGIKRLRELSAGGAEFRGASPYVQILMKEGK